MRWLRRRSRRPKSGLLFRWLLQMMVVMGVMMVMASRGGGLLGVGVVGFEEGLHVELALPGEALHGSFDNEGLVLVQGGLIVGC